jgi:di/tricarboxylate transporter
VKLTKDSSLVGKTLSEVDFRNRFDAMVLAIRRNETILKANIQDVVLRNDDRILLTGSHNGLTAISRTQGFEEFKRIEKDQLFNVYHLDERLLLVIISPRSELIGKTLKESRLGAALGMRVLCIIREDGTVRMPDPMETLLSEDQLIVEGRMSHFELIGALDELEVDHRTQPDLKKLVSEKVGIVETILSPHSTLAGKTLRQLHFREKFSLNVLAIWRRGEVYSTSLRDMAFDFGDALLLYGPRDKLQVLGRELDFIVLTEAAQEIPRLEKAKLAAVIMAATFVPVILGWVPIYISTVIGGALMVLSRCLTIEEAYRYIEWKAVFLIAGMFPLGIALDQSGAAKFLAEGVVAAVGSLGPTVVMLALLLLTFLATCCIPTAALVVLLAPIILNTAAQIGISPHSLMMAIAMAASASFMTPISHPANILVMGPGGYRFKDYLKVGGLLTVIVLIVVMVVVPIFWPLTPQV